MSLFALWIRGFVINPKRRHILLARGGQVCVRNVLFLPLFLRPTELAKKNSTRLGGGSDDEHVYLYKWDKSFNLRVLVQ